MLRILNIARIRRVALHCALLLPVIAAAACQRVPLLAPSGSTITLNSAATAVPANGSAQLIAQVVEASGTPPHSGTHIIFTTTLGTIEPSEAETDINGRAVVTFKAGNANGTASITASSGGASIKAENALKIAVGTAAVGNLSLTASPTTLGALGGSSTISAQVLDISGNLLPGVPVSFTVDAGQVSPGSATTGPNGVATTTLTTTRTSKVTAAAGIGGSTGSTTPGVQTKDITVTVNVGPSISLGSITTPAIAGQPVSVTVTITAPTAGQSPVRSGTLSWGDGGQTPLGTSSTVLSHTYFAPGTYTITATATDTNGDTGQAVASVTVLNRPVPTASISPDNANPTVNTVVTYTISAAPASGATNTFIQSVQVDFGDGNGTPLGSQTGTGIKAPHLYTAVGLYTATVTVTDTNGGTATASTQIIVKP